MAQKINEARLGVLVGQKNYRALREILSDMNAVDVAQFLGDLPDEQALLTFRTLPKDAAMDVFAELDADVQQHIVESITDREVQQLMDELAVDDAVDMLEEMPATLVKRVLRSASPDARKLINEFLRYPENSAGSIMTVEYVDLRRTLTVEDAIKRIRRIGEDRETIYTCYVIDAGRYLQGVVTVKDLLMAHDTQTIEELMVEDVISVTTTEDQETAAKLMAKYDMIALPVVDAEGRLVGIVTVDDAVDVIQEEATEDFEKMAAMAPSEKPYLKTGVFTLSRNRFVWLLVLMVSATVTGGIIGYYEAAFLAMPILLTFTPMLTDAGGNAGSQSSTMVIRGMALGEITMSDFFAVIWKEARVSALIAVPLAVVNYVRILLTNPGQGMVALTVSLALVCTMILANAVGGILPMLAKACKLDPALMAAPLIATIVDACSLILYFVIAMALLRM